MVSPAKMILAFEADVRSSNDMLQCDASRRWA